MESSAEAGASRDTGATRKRVLTEDRKKQNREAQRRFRQRKKAASDSQSASVSPHATQSTGSHASWGNEDFGGPSEHALAVVEEPDSMPVITYANVPGISVAPHSAPAFTMSGDQFTTRWVTSLASQTRENLAVPSPYTNYLQIQKLNFYAARMQNAKHMGVPQRMAELDLALSPWYWDTQFSLMFLHAYPPNYSNVLPNPPTVNRGELFPPRFGHFPQPLRNQRCYVINNDVNADLRPTELQRSKAHALYIDMIPFPIFRDRVITMLAMSPPAFDEDELRRDMENDGVLVWGGARVERSVRDRRNWECAKWFLAKWTFLVNGSGMEDQSRWWRQMRGEDDSDDEG